VTHNKLRWTSHRP